VETSSISPTEVLVATSEADEEHLFGHFCRDAYDTPESIYDISIDGSQISVTKP